MKKIVSVVTASVTDYSFLKPIINRLSESEELDIRIAVTGTHLSPAFDLTYQEIEKDGFIIDKKIENRMDANTISAVSKSMGLALIGFSEYFAELKPDIVIVLVESYEVFAVCFAAMNGKIPIINYHTNKEVDMKENMGDAITKMSLLHFVPSQEQKKRVIQLGEMPERVFCFSADEFDQEMELLRGIILKNEFDIKKQFYNLTIN